MQVPCQLLFRFNNPNYQYLTLILGQANLGDGVNVL